MTTMPAKASNPNEAKPTLSLSKTSNEVKISLKAICADMKIDPRVAREKLRIAAREAKKFPELAKAHKPRAPWEWLKGSLAEKEARLALAS